MQSFKNIVNGKKKPHDPSFFSQNTHTEKPRLSEVIVFNNFENQMHKDLQNIENDKKILSHYYQEYFVNFYNIDNDKMIAEIDSKISAALVDIYNKAKNSLDAFKKANPGEVETLSRYNILREQFKKIWDGFLQDKMNFNERRAKVNVDINKKYLNVVYDNIASHDIEMGASLMMEGLSLTSPMISAKVDVAQETLNYVQSRHYEVLKLEKSVAELYQLFIDMAALTIEQGGTIDRINSNIKSAKNNTHEAVEILTEAKKASSSSVFKF